MSKVKTAQLHKSVRPYTFANNKKSIFQILNTILPLFVSWTLAYLSVSYSIWLALFFTIIASGLIIRTFIIFHDCTHGSFFHNKRLNDTIGTITGVLTFFPYEKWKREHAIHHATSSNLDARGVGDIWVMTVDEYKDASKWERFAYRMYRNPVILFGFGPIYLILISGRVNRKDARKKERYNTYLTNALIVLFYGTIAFFVGWQSFLIVQVVSMYIAGSLGIWLFYIQHTFEDSYYEEESEWDYVKAAVDGSSYYKLPRLFQWLTGNIGYHHVHHLAPRVPNYNLENAHESTPPLKKATTITLASSLKSIRFRLYDEASKSFVRFSEVKALLKKRKLNLQITSENSGLQEK